MSENIQQHTAVIETAFLDRNLSYNELNDFLEEFPDLSLLRWGKVTEHHDDFAGVIQSREKYGEKLLIGEGSYLVKRSGVFYGSMSAQDIYDTWGISVQSRS